MNSLALQKEVLLVLSRQGVGFHDRLLRVLSAIVRGGYANGVALSLLDSRSPQPFTFLHYGLSKGELRQIRNLAESRKTRAPLRGLDSCRLIEEHGEWTDGDRPHLLVAVPVQGWEAGEGTLWLVTEHSRQQVASDSDLFEILGWELGAALRDFSLKERAHRQNRELDVIFEVSRAITATLDLDELLRLIVDAAVTTVPSAKSGVIHLLDRNDGYLHPRALSYLPHIPGDAVGQSAMRPGQGVAGQALETGLVVNVADIQSDPGFVSSPTGRIFRSLMVAPLTVEGEGIGTLSIDSQAVGAFSSTDEKLISLLASQAAIAIQNAQLFTDLKRTQDQLIRSEKLSALGQLIAGVAHELNNPLTSVMAYAELLQRTDGLAPGVKRDLTRIHSQAKRAGGIVRNLLTFARQREPQRVRREINRLLETTLELPAYQLLVNNIRMKKQLGDHVLFVSADPQQLQQVFLNVINNAQEVMVDHRGGGTLTVTTRRTGNVARIEFADDGPGIAPEIMNRVFDPFFTTKEVGKGTGLGLSICFGIVTEHGGQIWAENHPTGGAVFIIELPIDNTLPVQYEEKSIEVLRPLTVQPAGRKRVLVVDDEQNVCEVLRRVLGEDGYEADLFSDAQAAWQAILRTRTTAEAYDLIVTDIRMPGLDGRDFYERLRRIQPEMAQRVIFVTGDTATEDTMSFLRESGRAYVAKPFAMDKLRRAVREVMAQ